MFGPICLAFSERLLPLWGSGFLSFRGVVVSKDVGRAQFRDHSCPFFLVTQEPRQLMLVKQCHHPNFDGLY